MPQGACTEGALPKLRWLNLSNIRDDAVTSTLTADDARPHLRTKNEVTDEGARALAEAMAGVTGPCKMCPKHPEGCDVDLDGNAGVTVQVWRLVEELNRAGAEV